MAFDWAITPGQGTAGCDGVIVIAAPLRKPLQRCEGTVRCPGQPRLQLVRLVRTQELRKVLGAGESDGHLRRRCAQLGELGGLIRILSLWSLPHEPGRPTGGEVAG